MSEQEKNLENQLEQARRAKIRENLRWKVQTTPDTYPWSHGLLPTSATSTRRTGAVSLDVLSPEHPKIQYQYQLNMMLLAKATKGLAEKRDLSDNEAVIKLNQIRLCRHHNVRNTPVKLGKAKIVTSDLSYLKAWRGGCYRCHKLRARAVAGGLPQDLLEDKREVSNVALDFYKVGPLSWKDLKSAWKETEATFRRFDYDPFKVQKALQGRLINQPCNGDYELPKGDTTMTPPFQAVVKQHQPPDTPTISQPARKVTTHLQIKDEGLQVTKPFI
ncbi:hypothetical protein FDENT_13956 [Fusarium denticulatum]|uniref:Uncharacterized protein n=1 Tax=Fusarium denticulatum TaxID=48507 RepID=A0A8H5SYW1_9HYPO|nr:hypothetical protein FDENT_13956 [Fusarium denticulatum]